MSGWDRDREVLRRALALGAIDEGSPDIAAAVREADVVFVATPLNALAQTIGAALENAPAHAVISDVGSTKRAVSEDVRDSRFVPGHPLAGSEASGVQSSREDLFENATWYLSPADERDRTGPSSDRQALEQLIRAFGADPRPIEPELHDRLMATVSHLPHVLANALVGQALATQSKPAMGPSFRDATRVAGSNSAIWTDIYLSNRDALVAAIDELDGRLAEVRAALVRGDAGTLFEWNERARAERETLLGPGS